MTDDYVQEPAEVYGEQLKRLVIKDERTRQFVMVDYAVLDVLPAIKRNGLTVYCVLLRFANRHSRLAWPTWSTLQRLTGLGRDSVRRALRDLETAELIDTVQLREKGGFSSNAYRILDLSTKNAVSVETDDGKLDVQESDVEKLVNNLDPVLSRSRSELEKKDKDAHTREDAECVSFFSEDEGAEEADGRQHAIEDMTAGAREAMASIARRQAQHEATMQAEADTYQLTLCETPIPDHETMGFECEHVKAAQFGLTDILGYKPKKGLEALRRAVHEYPPFDILAVAKAYTKAEPDRAKWGLAYIYTPKLIEGRIAAVHAPPVPPKDARPPDRFERSPIYKVFPQDREWKELTGGDAMSMEKVIGKARTYEEDE